MDNPIDGVKVDDDQLKSYLLWHHLTWPIHTFAWESECRCICLSLLKLQSASFTSVKRQDLENIHLMMTSWDENSTHFSFHWYFFFSSYHHNCFFHSTGHTLSIPLYIHLQYHVSPPMLWPLVSDSFNILCRTRFPCQYFGQNCVYILQYEVSQSVEKCFNYLSLTQE